VAQRKLYENDAEKRQHSAAISHLARELKRSEMGILPLYEIVLARFNRTARIRDFLTVLVGRRVRDLLRSGPTKEREVPTQDIETGRSHHEEL
jgi:hypothetical protein